MTTYIRFAVGVTGIIASVIAVLGVSLLGDDGSKARALGDPTLAGKMSLEEALAKRRSIRSFAGGELSAQQISQLCWAAQGICEPARRLRTCPSAGATYPLELYVVTAQGVEHYRPQGHGLTSHLDGDLRGKLAAAAMGQRCVAQAPATFVIAGVASRTARRYGQRAQRYVWMEAGHAGQNILLQAVALKLAAVPVGAFNDEAVGKLLKLPAGSAPLYLIPVGKPTGPK